MNEIGMRLQNLREAKQPVLSRKKTAELIGLHPDMIRRYERGETKPSADALILLANYYQVTSDYILGLENFRETHKSGNF